MKTHLPWPQLLRTSRSYFCASPVQVSRRCPLGFHALSAFPWSLSLSLAAEWRTKSAKLSALNTTLAGSLPAVLLHFPRSFPGCWDFNCVPPSGVSIGPLKVSHFLQVSRFRSRDFSEENNPVAALSEMMDLIDASPKTTVAALNGPALGGGCEAIPSERWSSFRSKSMEGLKNKRPNPFFFIHLLK